MADFKRGVTAVGVCLLAPVLSLAAALELDLKEAMKRLLDNTYNEEDVMRGEVGRALLGVFSAVN
jgi:hypothetical protein